jgi:long-chain acyl-CoA synthetase
MVLPAAATAQEIGDALRGARPTVMIGVPRLYAALAEGIARRARARGVVSAALFATLKAVARPLRRFGPGTGRTLFRPVHRAMGGRLRFMVSGGAQLEPAIVHDLDTLGFEVLTGYGLAETASLFTGNRPGAKRIGTEGRPLADGEVRIAFDAENAAAEEGIGEIQLKGASVFAGYRGPAATDRDSFTADGWFRTGDLGRLDDDGYLVVTGRCKEVLVLGGGKNVIPEPLERHYGEAPGLREIAVLEHNGQLVALAVPDIGALRAEGKTSTEDALRIELTARGRSLPPYQRLAGFAISRVPLPRNRLGKYRRFLLPKLFEDAHAARPGPRALSAEDRALVSGGAGAIAWAVLVERFAVRGLDMDADPRLDLGMDSLEWMNISMELERRLGARLDDQTVAGVETVRELVLEAIAAHDRGGGAVAAHPAEDSPQWIAPRRKPERVTAALLRAVNRALMRALFRLRVEGVAPLAGVKGGTVIVANHASDLDPALLMAALPSEVARRCWWGVDAGRLAESGVIRAVCRVFPVFPVDERAPQTALDLARQVLGRGDCLAWFPESWRSPDGTVQRFLQGIGAVLEGRAVTVVPAYIAGSFEVMATNRRRPSPEGHGFGSWRREFAAPLTEVVVS